MPTRGTSNIDREIEKAVLAVEARRQSLGDSKVEVMDAIAEPATDPEKIEECLEAYHDQLERFFQLQDRLLSLYAEAKEEDKYKEETKKKTDLEKEARKMSVKARKLLQIPLVVDTSNQGNSGDRRRLPRLELPRFAGDVRDWLQFWSQFEEIHKDTSISDSDKFQYLIQSTVPDSEVRTIVESYPLCAKNYPLAIENLKERYGRDKMLIKVYVRDLLKLVVESAQGKDKSQFPQLYTQLSAKIRALGTIGVTTDDCASIIYPLVECCLPEDILRAWQRDPVCKTAKEGKDELDKLMEFLKAEVRGEIEIQLACSGLAQEEKKRKTMQEKTKYSVPTAAGFLSADMKQEKKISCIFCEKNHASEKCGAARSLSLEEKLNKIKEKKRCLACLKPGHLAKKCKSFVNCVGCGKKHEMVLCPDLPHHQSKQHAKQNEIAKATPEATADKRESTGNFANHVEAPQVLLQTVVVLAHGIQRVGRLRALLDSGSHKSYILKAKAKSIGLEVVGKENVIHCLFGGAETTPQQHTRYSITLSDLDDNYRCKFEVSDITCISESIMSVPPGPWIDELKKKKIVISDVNNEGSPVDLLIGADVIGKLMTGKKIELLSGPVAVETKLGWTVMGKTNASYGMQNEEVERRESNMNMEVPVFSNTLHVHDMDVTKLWDLDVLGIRDSVEVKTREEHNNEVLQQFEKNLKKNSDGRFEVELPWKAGHPTLPSNRWVAEKRLASYTEKLQKDGMIEKYDKVFKLWESLGIIEEVPASDESSYGHYLPHRPVYNPNSTTTPIRPVFDASCKTKGQPSLNECLETGPNLIEQIAGIVTKFRLRKIGMLADIEKAFQQISMSEKDRDSTRFLWWKSLSCEQMKIYRHLRVVFGVSSSPFILGATIKHLLQHVPKEHEKAAKILMKSLYVDNLVTSLDSIEAAQQFKQDAEKIFEDGKFKLRGWEIGPTDYKKVVPVLGMLWDMKQDCLKFDVSDIKNKLAGPVTKKKILSLAHQIFDPMGFLSPILIIPKVLIQQACSLKVGWDTELPVEISSKFQKWSSQLPWLENVNIPRCITTKGSSLRDWSLHVFGDASGSAFATCVFLRVGAEESVDVHLLMSKSRVAPVKKMTIPRLELLSCLISCRLAEEVKKMLEYEDIPVIYWTDSSTSLHWIKNNKAWGTFVANRRMRILKTTEVEQWYHIPGEANPADLPSRGCSVDNFVKSRWWEGPRWLKEKREDWPCSPVKENVEEIHTEIKKTVVSSLNARRSVERELYERVCKLTTYDEMIAEVGKWKEDGQVAEENILQVSTAAEKTLLKMVQDFEFNGVKDKNLKKLRPSIDKEKLIRIETKLLYGDFPDYFKKPIVLPKKGEVVEALIMKYHLDNSHGGPHFLRCQLREKYWIIDCRRTITRVLKKCQTCQRFDAKKLQCTTPPLPKDRVQAEVPFELTGIDLAGPMTLKDGRKCWIALFTCGVYRAIHLELVTQLSTDSMKAALRRFISRRGRPRVIYSDNGTNMVGCNNAMKKINWKKIEKFSSCREIEWRFIPPSAPWYGGWWERMVGIVKRILRKVLGKATVTFQDLETILCDVEAVVNQRPLTYISESQDELVPLTPYMFLTGVKSAEVPELDVIDGKSLNKKLKSLMKIKEELRVRFRQEYLSQLVSSSPVRRDRNIKVGDIVIVEIDNKKRMDWPLGKVVETFTGRDGKIHRVKVETREGEYMRAIQRIYPMEASHEDVGFRSLLGED